MSVVRKIIASEMLSVEGFMEEERGRLDWFAQDEELNDEAMNLLESVDAIIYGRVTYEMMAGFWPYAPGPFAARTNELQKYVVTGTLKETPWGTWNNARPLSGKLSEEIERLKNEPGKDMVIYGSGSVVRELTEHGLIDEYRLIVNPVVLGKGTPLFGALSGRLPLKLHEAKVFPSGAVALTYEKSR
ncbi:dihydrofolate reductase family protein [Paenibacillus flagellatus]|nr:dihydrofolate reductase family protein [Paenibacillus flagellatus]